MILHTLVAGYPDAHNVQISTVEAREPQATTTENPIVANTTPMTPFMPNPSTLQPVPPSNNNSKAEMTKSVVEFLVLGVATFIVALIIIRRLMNLKKRNQPYSAFFSSNTTYPSVQSQGGRNSPRTTGIPPLLEQTYPEPLPRFPPAHLQYSTRHIHAADVDSGGRRAAMTELDYDRELGDKDTLPAYDISGGPPKYFELEMRVQTRLFGRGNSSRATVDQPRNRLDNVDIPCSIPSHGVQQPEESQRRNTDDPSGPPQSSDEDFRRSSAINPTNDAARPRERTALTNDA